MDVDEEEGEGSQAQDPDGDVEMTDGEEGEKAQRTRKKKKPRKSQLNIDALQTEAEAIAILDSNEMLHLKLRKRYYAEGLSFIRQIEQGMKIIEQLLASTAKPEVLEAMEFFRVAHEYQFDSAEVSRTRRSSRNFPSLTCRNRWVSKRCFILCGTRTTLRRMKTAKSSRVFALAFLNAIAVCISTPCPTWSRSSRSTVSPRT